VKDKTEPEEGENQYLLPVEKAKRRFRSRHSESNASLFSDNKSEEASLYAAPSLHSLISLHDDIREFETEVVNNAMYNLM